MLGKSLKKIGLNTNQEIWGALRGSREKSAWGGPDDKEASRAVGKPQGHGGGSFLCCRWLGRCELKFRGASLEVELCVCAFMCTQYVCVCIGVFMHL